MAGAGQQIGRIFPSLQKFKQFGRPSGDSAEDWDNGHGQSDEFGQRSEQSFDLAFGFGFSTDKAPYGQVWKRCLGF